MKQHDIILEFILPQESHLYSHDIIESASQLISQYFQKKIHFSQVVQISEADRRNLILRLLVDNPTDNMPRSLILKQTATEKNVFDAEAPAESEIEQLSRFAHDWAGLELLTEIGSNHAPHFYGGNIEHKFILTEDLGREHPSLVGPLTKKPSLINLNEAEQSLMSYVSRLGQMHADTAGKYSQFTAILNRIYPHALRFNTLPETEISYIINQLKRLINIETIQLTKEIYDVMEFSQNPHEFSVLLHGDICPDNVYYQDKEIKLIDFEWSDFGNALIDGTYLRMSMPSCWCSKSVPANIVQRMEFIYREELKKGIVTAIDDPVYYKQLAYACAYWLIRTLKQLDAMNLLENEWICPSGPVDMESQWDPNKNAFRPRILSRLDAFISCSNITGHLPKLSEAATQLLNYLKKAWPETLFIDVFPVFK